MKRLLFIVWLGAIALSAHAREALNVPARSDGEARKFIARVAATCNPPASRVNLDINNVRAMILRGNDYWWDQGEVGMHAMKFPNWRTLRHPKTFLVCGFGLGRGNRCQWIA